MWRVGQFGPPEDDRDAARRIPRQPGDWPIANSNAPIKAGLKPEQGATLQLYNYSDYIDPAAIKAFEAKYKSTGVKVKVTTFNDLPEALAKIKSGQVPYDVFFPSYDFMGKLVVADLVRPLNHDYIPNIKNVWPEFTNPFYDGEWRYTVPYSVYTTGIAWRIDLADEDVSIRGNPWDVLWDTQYRGKVSVLDDYRETPQMVLLRHRATDVNTGDPAQLKMVLDDLLAMTKATKPKTTVNAYSEMPDGKYAVSHTWSGDAVNMPFYLPEDVSPDILRYWFPPDGKGLVNNDIMVILRTGKNPVLSHLFLDHVLDTKICWVFQFHRLPGPQSASPRLTSSNRARADKLGPPSSCRYFGTGYRNLELPPDVDAEWAAVWQRFKAGA